MNATPRSSHAVVAAFLLILLGSAAAVSAQIKPVSPPSTTPDAPVTAVTYSPHTHITSCHTNLGPTGATSWLRGYHFVVASIQHQSPAEGVLHLSDVVIGVATNNGQTMFGPDADPRITLGNAINAAEGSGDPLQLIVLRDGEQTTIDLALEPIGRYADTWPADCPKSRHIVEGSLQRLALSQMASGKIITDGNQGTYYGGLLMLAAQNPRYMDALRRAAHATANTEYAGRALNNWNLGYGGILVAEYYLATGDDSVLPGLQRICDTIIEGQMISGTWGPRTPASGYGALNISGLPCAITLALARKCGLAVDDAEFEQTIDFFERFASTGAVPYGDGRPGRAMDDNGKSSAAGILMHLAGRDAAAHAFFATVADSYWLREQGHTGGFYSIKWGGLAAAFFTEDKRRAFLDYQTWYYDMSRLWTGGFSFIPYREALTRFDSATYIGSGPEFTTGGTALVHTIAKKPLQIMGAPQSVFDKNAAPIAPLQQARDLYLDRDWTAFDDAMANLEASKFSPQDEQFHAQLTAARDLAKAAIDHALIQIDSYIVEGDVYGAKKKLEALQRAYGNHGDPRFAVLDERFAEGNMAWYLREGEEFWEKWEAIHQYAIKTWVPSGRHAKHLLSTAPPVGLPVWEPLSPTSQVKPQTWHIKHYRPGVAPDADWYQLDFDHSDWLQNSGTLLHNEPGAADPGASGAITVRRTFTINNTRGTELRLRIQTMREARTKAYLNGHLIVDLERGQRGGYVAIPLDHSVLSILKKGENTLALTSTRQKGGNNRLDAGLEINRAGALPRSLPITHTGTHPTASLPDEAETSLVISETSNEYARMLSDRYMAMSIPGLVDALSDVNHYYRALAEQAIVAKGLAGVEAAAQARDSEDWKARSSIVSLLGAAHRAFKESDDQAGLDFVSTQVPWIIQKVSDDHYWVRYHAASVLSQFEDKARPAADALLAATQDPEEWVRDAALRTLKAISDDDEQLIAAVKNAVNETNSNFGIVRHSVSAVNSVPMPDDTKLDILVTILRQPPEGGGGRLLSEVIDMAVALDPDGDIMIPVLIEAAADGTRLSLQRGNPHGKAIEALASYGEKARSAVPVLRAILANDHKEIARQHDAAKAAIEAITGQPVAEPEQEQAMQRPELIRIALTADERSDSAW